MTAPGVTAPPPGRATYAGRPAGVLCALVLAGLLVVLPSAGRAQAVGAKQVPPAVTTVTGPAAHTAHAVHSLSAAQGISAHHGAPIGAPTDAGLPLTWCSADGEHPLPGNGCSSHPYCGQESQLPNAPPQPAAAVPAQLSPPRALPSPAPLTTLAGPDLAPDLHALQVLRT
ncbi:hypothetical protein GCM10010193_02180 [Kitasatospora atroaurantiaca]|uniref:Uncharacterized protein n=1 Tax=Kitasatospora atroaurantiaca TaxID=285545 RepID=A0A561ELJ7_9ACTN|nr:hypothetical protein [Kitasatospora atroaurantiaca]TWE16439.1 hypothetical protein FB465_1421 [Kitasatospora atroaurantiaca]